MLTLLLLAALGSANPDKVHLDYTLRVNPADSVIQVDLRITNAPRNLILAAHAHPEYDDKFWRFLAGMTATDGKGQSIPILRQDSVLWKLTNNPGTVLVHYSVRIPREQTPRAAWRPFISPTGALVGGPHSFLYVVGAEKATTAVTFDIPKGWKVATAYQNGSDVFRLMESPMLVGLFGDWSFEVQGIPHRIAYWRKAGSTTDTVAFVRDLERVTRAAIQLFGGAPYQHYTFIFQDDAYGGLEHPNSVTLGTPAMRETAHEFVHTWNLMHFKPIEYRQIDYKVQPPVTSLWFAEGLTIFYADLLQRRAGISLPDSLRTMHLRSLITSYLSSPGHSRFSAEDISRVAYNAPPWALGDFTASAHIIGEALGVVLDAVVRDATNGARSMDDVMRLMNTRFGGKTGYTGNDIERAVSDVCSCSVRQIFDSYVRGAGMIDFNRYLALIGLRADITSEPARNADGTLAKDLRVWGLERGDHLIIRISDPSSLWGRAGLHTGDKLVSINGAPVRTWPELRTILIRAAIGDSLDLVYEHNGQQLKTRAVMSGYDRPLVSISELTDNKAARLREGWLAGR